MKIQFITGNSVKFKDAAHYFSAAGIELKQTNMAVPEIQADCANEVCRAKANYVSERICGPFFVEDSSFHIPSLLNFPGIYARYVLETLGTEGILRAMTGIDKRDCYFKSCIVFCDGANRFHKFSFIRNGLFITEHAGKSITGWSELWRIIGVAGLGKHVSEASPEQRAALESEWSQENTFTRLIEYIRGKYGEKEHL